MITGYKIRYKKEGERKGNPVTVDANQRSFALSGASSALDSLRSYARTALNSLMWSHDAGVDDMFTELERGTSYQIRIQALNVNGSGPPTEWLNKVTYVFDLDGRSSVNQKPFVFDECVPAVSFCRHIIL